MPFPFDKYPWLNFQELNLAYFIKHFREIFEQWGTLLNEMYDWKDATDEDLAEWKTTVETGISSWETGLMANLEEWKSQTATDISGWETATLAALDAWKTATTAVFEQIRTEAAASATAAAGSASTAETAKTAAQTAQAAAEAAAAQISASLAQIQQNTDDISALESNVDEIESAINFAKQETSLNRSIITYPETNIVTPEQIQYETNWACLCIPASEGDVFTVSGTGGAGTRLWAFSTSEGSVISQAASGASGENIVITAPENTAYLAFNSRTISGGQSVSYSVYKGYRPTTIFAEQNAKISALEAENAAIESTMDDYETMNQEIVRKMQRIPQSDNLCDNTKLSDGYMTEEGNVYSNDDYYYTDFIPVDENDVITCYNVTSQGVITQRSPRFIAAFTPEKNVVRNAGSSTPGTSFTVPAGIAFLRITFTRTWANTIMILSNYDGAPNHYIPYYAPYYTATPEFIKDSLPIMPERNSFVLTENKAALSTGETMTACTDIDNKKNDLISFYAELDAATFSSVLVGHGYNMNYGAYCVIDDTNITIFAGTSQYAQEAHGLSIDKYIHIEIEHGDNARATIRLYTLGGSYEIPNARAAWGGSKGSVFATSNGSSLRNCSLSTVFRDWLSDIFLFGDSYVGFGDTTRWPLYLINNGYTKLSVNGFGGATSGDEIKTFRNILAHAIPRYVVWTLGMNDADSSEAINADYKNYLDEVVSTCEEKGITPILATIPNVPNRLHTFKNAYVKSLGYRYIDFAAAVGAESAGSSWWTGLLSQDNVHPTILGAKALYSKLVEDFPEVTK